MIATIKSLASKDATGARSNRANAADLGAEITDRAELCRMLPQSYESCATFKEIARTAPDFD